MAAKEIVYSQPARAESAPVALTVSVAEVAERPIARFIRVTGTLTAQEQAEVAAETSGRIVATLYKLTYRCR